MTCDVTLNEDPTSVCTYNLIKGPTHHRLIKVLQRPQKGSLILSLILIFFFTQAFLDTALCGFTSLFGRFMPYLLEVDLGEHYFIQGLRHARSEAIGHFARLGEFISLWYLGHLTIDCNHIALTNQDRHRSHTALTNEDLSNELMPLIVISCIRCEARENAF